MPTYALESFDLDFFDTAPVTHKFSVNLPVSPERAWAELTRQNTLDWCRLIKAINFTSPAPYGVGTTRSAQLAPGYARLSERFFCWDEDPQAQRYRNAFYVEQANVPGLRRFGELSEIEPAERGCRFTWSFAIELGGPLARTSKFALPVSAKAFGTLETDTVKYFANLR
ncbi:MxaD family protein [Williamsia sp. 1138]|uniref:SRPBCC family protein n=1 Tax=Williamsia sp. 1138 TaxID=1903117 RepID=UPI000A101154|nr:SRPBCC family protein [Williamsia sp. 1138]OZG26200.1 MxaD family protein [Williamsia sp. 1138]